MSRKLDSRTEHKRPPWCPSPLMHQVPPLTTQLRTATPEPFKGLLKGLYLTVLPFRTKPGAATDAYTVTSWHGPGAMMPSTMIAFCSRGSAVTAQYVRRCPPYSKLLNGLSRLRASGCQCRGAAEPADNSAHPQRVEGGIG